MQIIDTNIPKKDLDDLIKNSDADLYCELTGYVHINSTKSREDIILDVLEYASEEDVNTYFLTKSIEEEYLTNFIKKNMENLLKNNTLADIQEAIEDEGRGIKITGASVDSLAEDEYICCEIHDNSNFDEVNLSMYIESLIEGNEGKFDISKSDRTESEVHDILEKSRTTFKEKVELAIESFEEDKELGMSM